MFSDRPRWLILVLAVSVLLNLFLAGVIAGRLSFPPVRPGVAAASGAMVARARVRELPVMERIRFGLAMRHYAGALRSGRDAVRGARRAAEEAIEAPIYDEALVKTRLAEARQAVNAQQTVLHNALADALSSLSAQSRAELVRGEKARTAAPPRP
jgi:uncharacterized membrane protein